MNDLPTFSYFATVGCIQPKMGDFEEEQREEVDALVSIFSEEMTVESLIFSDIHILGYIDDLRGGMMVMSLIIFDIVH